MYRLTRRRSILKWLKLFETKPLHLICVDKHKYAKIYGNIKHRSLHCSRLHTILIGIKFDVRRRISIIDFSTSRAINIISKYRLTLKNQISVSIFAQRFAYWYAKSGGNVFDCARDRSIFAPFKENQIPDLFGEHLISCLPK